MRYLISFCLIAVLCSAASLRSGEPKGGEPKGGDQKGGAELDQFKGSWKLLKLIISGKAVPGEKFAESVITIEADGKMQMVNNPGLNTPPLEISISLNTKTEPKGIDMRLESGTYKDQVCKGIYKFQDKNNLILCAPNVPAKGERPTAFESGENSGVAYMELQRLPK